MYFNICKMLLYKYMYRKKERKKNCWTHSIAHTTLYRPNKKISGIQFLKCVKIIIWCDVVLLLHTYRFTLLLNHFVFIFFFFICPAIKTKQQPLNEIYQVNRKTKSALNRESFFEKKNRKFSSIATSNKQKLKIEFHFTQKNQNFKISITFERFFDVFFGKMLLLLFKVTHTNL